MQTQTEIQMQEELDVIASMVDGKEYADYCAFEDDIAKLVASFCPTVQKDVNETGMGIFMLWGNIRNYIRTKANIIFKDSIQ